MRGNPYLVDVENVRVGRENGTDTVETMELRYRDHHGRSGVLTADRTDEGYDLADTRSVYVNEMDPVTVGATEAEDVTALAGTVLTAAGYREPSGKLFDADAAPNALDIESDNQYDGTGSVEELLSGDSEIDPL